MHFVHSLSGALFSQNNKARQQHNDKYVLPAAAAPGWPLLLPAGCCCYCYYCSSLVCLDADGAEVEAVGVGRPPGGHKHRVHLQRVHHLTMMMTQVNKTSKQDK